MITDEELARVPELQVLSHTLRCWLVEELQIRRKLQPYARHKKDCDTNVIQIGGTYTEMECTCGLSELLAKLKELEGV